MLARELRMRDGRDFSTTVRRGRRARHGHLVVHFAPGHKATKVGFIVSNSVGAAVTRNTVKRRLRHIVKDTSLTKGSYLVVRALPRARAASSHILQHDLSQALKKVHAG